VIYEITQPAHNEAGCPNRVFTGKAPGEPQAVPLGEAARGRLRYLAKTAALEGQHSPASRSGRSIQAMVQAAR
jgi:hypothetical protein